jgi:hypothetical protein
MKSENKKSPLKKLLTDQISAKQIADVRYLSAMGYTDNDIAKNYLRMRPDDFCRLKNENINLKESIETAKALVAIQAHERLMYLLEHATVEKNQIQIALYLHQKYSKVDDSLDLPSSIQISFAKKTEKTKEEIEKEADLHLLNEE